MFGNCLILLQLSERCPVHVKHLGVEWSRELVQGSRGISARHGISGAGHTARETVGDLRQVGQVLGQCPVLLFKEPSSGFHLT